MGERVMVHALKELYPQRRSNRREVVKVLDGGGRGGLIQRPLLVVDEQRGVPPGGHGGPRAPPVPVHGARPPCSTRPGPASPSSRAPSRPGHVVPELRHHRRGGHQLPLYSSLGMLLEFAALVWLRARRPDDLPRPYRVPMGTAAGRGRHVRRAVGVSCARRHGRRRVEGVRGQHGLHGRRRRGVLRHGVLQGQGMFQVWPCRGTATRRSR